MFILLYFTEGSSAVYVLIARGSAGCAGAIRTWGWHGGEPGGIDRGASCGDEPAPSPTAAGGAKQVFDSSPAILAVSPFAMERQLYSLAAHGATS